MKHGMLAVALALACASTAAAQEVTSGSIGGQVTDPQGLSLPGVTVSVTAGQGTQTFTTDEQGRFFAPFLTPGIYVVRAELSGFKPVEQRRVEVRLGQRAELTLKLEVGGVSETVEVTGGSAVVDVTSTRRSERTSTARCSHACPSSGASATRSISRPASAAAAAPAAANPSVAAAAALKPVLVDGVNITNPGYGALGSYSIVLGSLGTGVTYDFIKEVQVKTAGYEAEYGQATGGVVNVLTKSGTNQLRGTRVRIHAACRHAGHVHPRVDDEREPGRTVNVTQTQTSDVGIGSAARCSRIACSTLPRPIRSGIGRGSRRRLDSRFVMRQASTPTGSAAFWRTRPRARGKCRRRTGSTRHFSATRRMGRRVRSAGGAPSDRHCGIQRAR